MLAEVVWYYYNQILKSLQRVISLWRKLCRKSIKFIFCIIWPYEDSFWITLNAQSCWTFVCAQWYNTGQFYGLIFKYWYIDIHFSLLLLLIWNCPFKICKFFLFSSLNSELLLGFLCFTFWFLLFSAVFHITTIIYHNI